MLTVRDALRRLRRNHNVRSGFVVDLDPWQRIFDIVTFAQRTRGVSRANTSGRFAYGEVDEDSGEAQPVGFCSLPGVIPEKHGRFASRYHDDGHETPEEAREHFKEFLLFTKARLVPLEEPTLCVFGDQIAKHAASIDGETFVLCREHMNRATIAELMKELPL